MSTQSITKLYSKYNFEYYIIYSICIKSKHRHDDSNLINKTKETEVSTAKETEGEGSFLYLFTGSVYTGYPNLNWITLFSFLMASFSLGCNPNDFLSFAVNSSLNVFYLAIFYERFLFLWLWSISIIDHIALNIIIIMFDSQERGCACLVQYCISSVSSFMKALPMS